MSAARFLLAVVAVALLGAGCSTSTQPTAEAHMPWTDDGPRLWPGADPDGVGVDLTVRVLVDGAWVPLAGSALDPTTLGDDTPVQLWLPDGDNGIRIEESTWGQIKHHYGA